MSEDITLPCEHNFTESEIKSLAWMKINSQHGLDVIAEFDRGDTPPKSVYKSMVGRALINLTPSQLHVTNVTMSDASDEYLSRVVTVDDKIIQSSFKVTVNGKDLAHRN